MDKRSQFGRVPLWAERAGGGKPARRQNQHPVPAARCAYHHAAGAISRFRLPERRSGCRLDFRQPLSQGRWNKRRERFFRRPLNPQVRCVPQSTHAVGWGYRENGERVRAYRTYPTCGLRLACYY